MQRILLLFIFQDARIGLTEHLLIELVAKALTGFVNLLLHLLIVLGKLLLDEHICTIALLGVAIVNKRVVERIHMTTCFPDGRMHKNSRIDTHNIFVEQDHRLPPIFLDIILQFHTILTVVIHCSQTIIDVTTWKNKTIFLAMAYYFFEIVFLCHKSSINSNLSAKIIKKRE